MDLQSRKISFVQEFLRLQSEEIVSGLENFLRKKKAEQYRQQLQPMSTEEYEAEMDQAILDSQEDRIISVTDLQEKAKQWR